MGASLFSEVAKILLASKLKQGSLKTLIYASDYKNQRQLFAMANECTKYQPLLEQVLKLCPTDYIQDEFIVGDKEMALVFLYEYLIGRKFGRHVGMRKMMLRHKEGIRKAVDEVLKQLPGARNLTDVLKGGKDDISQKIPRYMRVNLLKSTVESVVENLTAEDWEYVGELPTDKFKSSVSSMTKYQFGRDPLLRDVLVFPVATDLHNHHMTQSGILIQQDRASCVPAHVLSPDSGATVLDCCAAPGNKTTHLTSLMGDRGQVIALDRDEKRLAILKRMVSKSGAAIVAPVHQDFLTLEPDSPQAADIQFILVDPSCSGSGMRCQDDHNAAASDEALRARLQTLKRFQISILKHALRFPSVRRVVYSTCSVYCQENEEVATEVMAHVADYFEFEPVLPEWPASRGLPGFPNSSCFLRLKPDNDLTQGFFVACFRRMKERKVIEEESLESSEKEEDGKLLKKKKKKKKDKKVLESDEDTEGKSAECEMEVSHESKKKRKKKKRNLDEEVIEEEVAPIEPTSDIATEENDDCKKRKKKKRKKEIENESDKVDLQENDDGMKKRKKRKKHKKENLEFENEDAQNIEKTEMKRRKKKKSKNSKKDDENMDDPLCVLKEKDEKGKNHKKRRHSDNSEESCERMKKRN